MPSTTSIHDIAKELQTQAEDNAKTRLSVSIIDKLKAHADQGIYTNSGISSLLSSNICNITDSHSNAENTSRNPCKNKDKNNERFSIGKVWAQDDQNVKVGHQGVYLPPRRRGMCTTNLENLDTTNTKGPLLGGTKGNDGKLASNSLLGDVLLAAYKEGENIKNGYSSNPSDPRICRAMKYSFADLGDIIRGRDLWSQQSEQSRLQQNLIKIFGNIKDKHPQIRGKYTGTDDISNLRSDWWTANRDQIWKAMTCQAPNKADLYVYKSGSIMTFAGKCGRDDTPPFIPPDDYIPQRLRWMTEWGENYCKKLESIYREVKGKCGDCKGISASKQCTRESSVCTSCSDKCTEYKKHVKAWKTQWKTLKEQYTHLYTIATNGGTTLGSNDPIQEKLNEFFKKLQEKGGKNYDNLEEYITQTRGNADCVDANQRHFDEVHKSSDEYAFRTIPHKYDTECKCKDEPCDVVETILKGQDAENEIENCKAKDKDGEYPKWECTDTKFVSRDGSCMPPRRQKLCIHDLKVSNLRNTKTEQELRSALIKCAAKETFFAWKKYKEDKQKEKPNEGGQTETQLDAQLKQGNIPSEFLRIMFYTYGDFRDICLGKDIGNDEAKDISGKITNILKEARQETTEQDLEEWWKTIQKDVWKGMLCGLSHHIKDSDEEKEEEARKALTDKSDYQYNYDPQRTNSETTMRLVGIENTHQFLRWFTEWSDEFCQKQKVEKNKLIEGCNGYQCNGDESNKSGCKTACGNYKNFIKDWEKHYTSQNTKLQREKNTYEDEIEESQDARDYLDKKLQGLGVKGDNNCMETPSTKSRGAPGSSMPQTLDQLPTGYDATCKCAEEDTPRPQAAKPAATKPATTKPATTKPVAQQEPCQIVATKLSGRRENIAIDKCSPKDYKEWECKKESGFVSGKGECMPPRRQKLCLYYLSQLNEQTSKKYDLRKALIECVAIETFFAWHAYKKNASDADKLETGDIPEIFKRIMFYTYSDYRDICLGKDIGTDGAKDISGTVTKILNSDGQTTDTWWETIKTNVWDAMVCGLSHAASGSGDATSLQQTLTTTYKYDDVTLSGGTTTTKLTEFVKIPQFLRWMTEWSEDFCKEQKEKYTTLQTECNECTVGSGGTCNNKEECEICKGECEQYQGIVQAWGNEWEKQKGKYETLYQQIDGTPPTDQKDQDVVTYLTTLTKSDATAYGTAGGYVKQTAILEDCKDSKQYDFDNNGDKYAFADYPKEYKEKCTCVDASASPSGPERTSHDPGSEASPPSPEGTTGQGAESEGEEAKGEPGTASRPKGEKGDPGAGGAAGPSGPQAEKGEPGKHGPSGEARTAEQGPGQGPGPGQQPPPPPQQQQSGQSEGGGGGGGGEDGVGGGEGKGKGGSDGDPEASPGTDGGGWWEKLATNILTYSGLAAYIGIQGADKVGKAVGSYLSCDPKPGPAGDGHSHGSQEGGAEGSGSSGTGSTGNQNPGSPRPSSADDGQDASSSSSSSSFSSSSSSSSTEPGQPQAPASPVLPPRGDGSPGSRGESGDQSLSPQLSQILGLTLPLTAGIAIFSLSYLLRKKKTPTGSTRTFRVIDVSKKDSIPTTKSTNRYVPHRSDVYKGKTYIYVEQPSSEDSGHYYEDTTDITSSSTESEYEDINDIYVPRKPKYKTLIEVVLEPSKRDNTYTTHMTHGDTYYTSITHDTSDIFDKHISPDIHSTHMYNIHDMPSGDIPTNKPISDNEWNQLKQDFISNMLQRKQINIPISNLSIRHGPIPDVPLSDITTDIPMNTHPYILHHKMDEIPFITQITDRDLHGGEHITYSINWNIPINTNMKTSNTMDDPKYVSNNIYTGNDLISDTLNGDLNFDIYSEMLKRKEKELHSGHNTYV
ncbi:erythrocyte membrane protein 1, PfEMP1,putative [Plasmodium sp. gorilla clade G3]|nr:erythrocyte membrane protein 1, PfEMP1,putative [Plasmodium sp. gorilla clade G3]